MSDDFGSDFGTDFSLGGITSTDVIQLPINCILNGNQIYPTSRFRETHKRAVTRRVTSQMGFAVQLSIGSPTFSVTTSNRGY